MKITHLMTVFSFSLEKEQEEDVVKVGGVEGGVIDVAGRVMDRRRCRVGRGWVFWCVCLCSRMTCNYPGCERN